MNRNPILIFDQETEEPFLDLSHKSTEELIDLSESGEITSPIAMLLQIINNPQLYDVKTRIDAAKQLLPYTNKKQPVITETVIHNDDKNFNITFGD